MPGYAEELRPVPRRRRRLPQLRPGGAGRAECRAAGQRRRRGQCRGRGGPRRRRGRDPRVGDGPRGQRRRDRRGHGAALRQRGGQQHGRLFVVCSCSGNTTSPTCNACMRGATRCRGRWPTAARRRLRALPVYSYPPANYPPPNVAPGNYPPPNYPPPNYPPPNYPPPGYRRRADRRRAARVRRRLPRASLAAPRSGVRQPLPVLARGVEADLRPALHRHLQVVLVGREEHRVAVDVGRRATPPARARNCAASSRRET